MLLLFQQQHKHQQQQRDYTGFDDNEAKLLRSMSNESFNWAKPILAEHKTAKTKLQQLETENQELKKRTATENLYEHEQGYTLTPEYQTQFARANAAQQVLEHWQEQMIAVNSGASEYTPVTGFDANGNLILGQPVRATPQEIGKVMTIHSNVMNQNATERAKLEMLVNGHTSKVQEARGWIGEFENATFPQFNQPEYKEQAKPFIEKGINSLHPAYRNNPLARPLIKAMIMAEFLSRVVSKGGNNGAAQAVDPRQQAIQQQRRKAGPTAADVGGDVSGGGEKGAPVTFDDFEAVKNGY